MVTLKLQEEAHYIWFPLMLEVFYTADTRQWNSSCQVQVG